MVLGTAHLSRCCFVTLEDVKIGTEIRGTEILSSSPWNIIVAVYENIKLKIIKTKSDVLML